MPRVRLAAAAFVLAAAAACGGGEDSDRYRTAEVRRGDLVASIGATGTLEPEELVDVGAQVAGQIVEFGKDKSGKTVDYGSEVAEGAVLAEIDKALFKADLAQARAQLDQDRAAVARAKANLLQLRAERERAERDWARAEALGPSDALAAESYDAFRAALETAKAEEAAGGAAIAEAEAAVARSGAAVLRAERNLFYSTIKSPVDGVIIDRRVGIGQTVVSSLNAPSLFLIAKDLRRMQVWAAVNEADIGAIRPGGPVTFTVDAFPNRTFKGAVRKVRLNASMTQNVVTYTVEVETDNSDGVLLPYLTANVRFEVARREGVLAVPNAALRFAPRSEDGEPAAPGALSAPEASANEGEAPRSRVWVLDGGDLRPVAVRTGVTDGSATEVEGIAEGARVVVREEAARDGAGTGRSPFAPDIRRGRRAH